MERISKHLSLEECIKSDTAKKLGLANQPTPNAVVNLKLLAEKVFEPIREHFKAPITVSSVYRGRALNQAVKGSTTSQHCSGQAMDIDNVKPSNKEIFDYIKDNLEFDQLIWEFGTKSNPDWVHVSYSNTHNRKTILKATKKNNKTHYEFFK